MSELPPTEVSNRKKKKCSINAKRKSMQDYVIPEGGLQSAETPGFEVKTHKKLRQSNFMDVLHHAQWEKWYYEQHVKLCDKKLQQIENAGATPEDRKISQTIAALEKRLAELKAKKK